MNFLSFLAETAEETLGEKLAQSGIVFLFGVAAVFFVLGLLIFLVWGIGKLLPPAEAAIATVKQKLTKSQRTEPVESAPLMQAQDDEEETVAAIMAAIAIINETENQVYQKQTKFVVRSINQIR